MRILVLFAAIVSTWSLISCQSSGRRSSLASRGVEEQVLPNGMRILWVPDDSLPYVTMQMMVQSGSADDPKGQEGVAQMVASMLDRGTKVRDATRISESLDQIGSEFSTSVTTDYTMVSLSMLAFNKNAALELYQDMILNPTFPKRELERERKNTVAGLKKMADRPESFSDFVMTRFIYGDHPYGHESSGDLSSVKKLATKDLERFYQTNYVPNNTILAVIGQFDAGWRAKVIAAFNNWPARSVARLEVPAFPEWQGSQVLVVDRSDLNQAQIRVGMKGVTRQVPEYMEVRAALKILGESMGSRLFDEVRIRRGLTYGIYAYFEPRLQTGPISIYTFTRNDKIGETVDTTLTTYREFVQKGVTEQEVKEVKELMRGQFTRLMETPEAIASQYLILKRYGIPESYLKDHFKLIDRLTVNTINAAIAKYFTTENLKILVYAPKGSAEPALKPVGVVQVKDYRSYLR